MSEEEKIIKIKIIERNEKGEILINLKKECENNSYHNFYNGGWVKIIEGLDKTQTNGYSHKGNFANSGSVWYKPKTPVVICDIGGSRKNHQKCYSLITIDENGIFKIIEEENSSNYATKFWKNIEELLKKSNLIKINNPLEKFTNEQLIEELRRRNIKSVAIDECN